MDKSGKQARKKYRMKLKKRLSTS